jgi:uncharacterized protein (TIGR02687 family)
MELKLMSELEQVAKLLTNRFMRPGEHGRMVFWRDEQSQYAGDLDSLVGENAINEALQSVQLVKLRNDPFNVRYRMFHEQAKTKFLVYMEGEAPAAKDDWLLDLELAYGPTFSADKLTMIATELLPEASPDTKAVWLQVMRRTPKFFESTARVNKLAALLESSDDERDFQAKMIAVLLKLKEGKHSLKDIWSTLLTQYADGDTSGIESIERMGLGEFHWTGTKRIYRFETDEVNGSLPTVKDFVPWLFRLAWQGFVDGKYATNYYANVIRDYDDWYKDVTLQETFRRLSDRVADDLMLHTGIAEMGIDELGDRDTFRDVDEILIQKLYERLGTRSIPDDRVQQLVTGRKQRLWYPEYANEYAAISAASTLQRMLDECTELIDSIVSPEQGFSLYCQQLYRADQAYRRYVVAWKSAEQDKTAVDDELQESYNAYQHKLGQVWQHQIDGLNTWSFKGIPAQTGFYTREVKSHTDNGKKIAVIISDALRYEVAEEFVQRLNTENRYSADISAQYSVLPSYTQLGMAVLLPHSKLSFDRKEHYNAVVDGHSATGTNNRDTILSTFGGRAIQAENLLNLKGPEARELMKSCEVLYVYHNHIDAIGDDPSSEGGTFEACERTFKDLTAIVKKLAAANVSNMIVTADHGFLYQDREIDDSEWLSEQPKGDMVWVKKRRFTIGSHLAPDRAFVTFNAMQVGLEDPDNEGVTVQMPNSIMRLKKQGTGVRYVHGGAALQEIVVPVVHINKGRASSGDVRKVEFAILQKSERLTSGQLTVEFVQNEPVGGKIAPRTVHAGFWGIDADGSNVLISNETPVAFDQTGTEMSERHVYATVMLTSDADRFNGKTIELRLRETIPGSTQMRTLEQRARYLLKRGVVADDNGFFD